MRSKMLKIAFGCACVLGMSAFMGCGDDSGSNSSKSDQGVSDVVDLELADGKAVVCDDDMEGVVAITKDDGYRKCVDGEWVKIKRSEALKADEIIGAVDYDDEESSSSSVIPGTDPYSSASTSVDCTSYPLCGESNSSKDGSSSSRKSSLLDDDEDESSSSNAKNDSSSSVIPGTDPYSSASTSVDCTSYPLCGESSSSKGGIPYTTECPAGKTCTYAPTEYLNPEITYGEFLDTRDYQVYKTVSIGSQTWMAQNLNYADSIKTISLKERSWCYKNELDSCAKYGRLYTWAAAIDSVALAKDGNTCGYGKTCDRLTSTALAANPIQGVCPSGWHLPSYAEWNTLFTAVGGISTAGTKLKSTSGWYSDGNGTDAYGFSALPAGRRYGNGDFDIVGNYAGFWSSPEGDSFYAYFILLNYDIEDAYLYDYIKYYGYSVRCIKND